MTCTVWAIFYFFMSEENVTHQYKLPTTNTYKPIAELAREPIIVSFTIHGAIFHGCPEAVAEKNVTRDL